MLRNKLKSNTGASISIALLLFLVCTVVGAVVLTAATASAGRVSQLAEADQRYYSVTSAAAFLQKELNDKPVTIRREEIYESTVTTTYGTSDITDAEGNKIGEEPTVTVGDPVHVEPYPAYKTYVEETEYSGSLSLSFLEREALYLLFGDAVSLDAAAMNNSFNHEKAAEPFTLEPTGFPEKSDLKITGTVTLCADGTMELRLQNYETTEKNPYMMKLTLTPAITETEETTSKTKTVGNVDTTTVTRARISTIKWNVSSIEVGNT